MNLSEQLKLDLENFTKTKKEILILNNIFPEDQQTDLAEYSRYVLREGTITAKRNLITGLNLDIYIHNKELILEKH